MKRTISVVLVAIAVSACSSIPQVKGPFARAGKNATQTDAYAAVPVHVEFFGGSYDETVPLFYSAKEGASGAAKLSRIQRAKETRRSRG